jgi:hypothetical protein
MGGNGQAGSAAGGGTGGLGGAGLVWIDGVERAGGGAGPGYAVQVASVGGGGVSTFNSTTGMNGTAYTGGGAGSRWQASGVSPTMNGGSGVVIIAIPRG